MATVNFSDIYKIKPNREKPAKGKVLVASPLLDEYFKRTVIYLVEGRKDDIFAGIILNKKSPYTLHDALPGYRWLPKIPIYYGGPVSNRSLLYLHCLGNVITGSTQVGDNIYIGFDMLPAISYISAGNKVEGYMKFFLGFSGWSPGQLNMEISTQSWGIGKLACTDKCLDNDEDLWQESVKSLGKGYSAWLRIPSSFSCN